VAKVVATRVVGGGAGIVGLGADGVYGGVEVKVAQDMYGGEDGVEDRAEGRLVDGFWAGRVVDNVDILMAEEGIEEWIVECPEE